MSSFLPSFNIPPNQRGIYLLRPRPVAGCLGTGAVNLISDAEFDERWPGGVITGDEYTIGTLNPAWSPAQYGAVGLFQPYVASSSFLVGQSQVGLTITGAPTLPLALDLDNSPGSFIANDGARPPGQQRSISGSPFINGPISLLFTEADGTTIKPVVGVSVNVGFLNEVGTIRVRAYSAAGVLLGTWLTTTTNGYQNINLNRDSDVPIIAALNIDNLGDTAGFTTSRVRFSNECA